MQTLQPPTLQPPVPSSGEPAKAKGGRAELEPEGRALGFVLVVAAAAVLVGATWTYSWYSGISERKIQDSLHSVILSKKATIEGFLEERREDAEALSRRESVVRSLVEAGAAPPSRESSRVLRGELSEAVNIHGYHDGRVVDRELRDLANYGGEPLGALEREVFLEVLERREPRVVDLHLERDGTVNFGVAQPVFGGEPSAAGTAPPASAPLLGLVYLEMGTFARFDDVVSGWPVASESAETVLFREEGEELLFLNPLRFLPDAPRLSVRRPLRSPGLLSAMLVADADTPIVTGVDYRGEPVIGAGTMISGTTWHILAKMDQSEARSSVRRVGASLAVTTLLSWLLLGGAGGALWARRRARFASEQSAKDAQYAAARRTSIDGYIIVNKVGVIVEANDATARMSGYSGAELVGAPLAQIHAMYSHEEILGVLSRIQKDGSARFRSGWRRKDGSVVHFDVSASYVPGPGGETWHCFLHDVGPELAAQARIDRLNSFYVFLSHANAAVFNVDTVEGVLAAVCEGAVRDAGFLVVWAGSLDPITGRVVPIAASGVEMSYVSGIDITIDATLPSGRGPTGRCLREQTVCYVNDFHSDTSVVAWRPEADLHGIRASAAVPIVVDGESVASLQFYSGVEGCFEGELLALLEEVGHTVSLAWRAILHKVAHAAALQRLEASELRLVRVLESTPIPTQVSSLSTRKMRMLNQAHLQTFGYRLEDIPDEERWFARVYQGLIPLAVVRSIWEADILRAIEGGPSFVVSSPELQVLRSDGRRLWVMGRVTVVNDDILVQWIDLSDIRRAEAELRANEQRFRGMIEHNLAAICVVIGQKIVYCNRRLSELTGWRVDELVGVDVTSVFRPDPEGFERIKLARERLKDGAPAIELTLACHIKDGRELLIGVHGSAGVWDGQPATVLTIQDVTERQHAEEKIAAYVQQLEGAVQSTLTAVAKMLDMRDPYTAGHERRVGLIAADIAKEMGWSEARCYALNLAGLVHDIGKIAVPAEILTKPTRLTALEYEMAKTHAELGYEILKDVDFLRPVATVIRAHHERLDGSGYPGRVDRHMLDVGSKVIAVADVATAMAE